MEFLFLLIWQRQKLLKFGLSALFLLLIFAPWANQVIREAQSIGGLDKNLDWIPKPGVINVLYFYSILNGPMGSRYQNVAGLLLFLLPVVWWFWKVVRSDLKSKEIISFSWLALLSFLPVIGLYLLSQRTDQAVWIDRYFIFISLPYLMLVAAAVFRLEPKWLRYSWVAVLMLWGLYAGIHDLRTNRMAWEGAQMGSRIPWDVMTRQMTAAEKDNPGPISVYTLTVISKDAQALLKRSPLEDHFWIAFFDVTEWPQQSPEAVLKDNGFRVGDPIMFQQLYNQVVLLPVWKK
jgi:hypothetical protein